MKQLLNLCTIFGYKIAQSSMDQSVAQYLAKRYPEVKVLSINTRVNNSGLLAEVNLSAPKDFTKTNALSSEIKRLLAANFGDGIVVKVSVKPVL